jgi:hypothetical protein
MQEGIKALQKRWGPFHSPKSRLERSLIIMSSMPRAMRTVSYSGMRSRRGLDHILTKQQITMGMSQCSAPSLAKSAVVALHKTSVELELLKIWEAVLVGKLTCPAFANSPAKPIINKKKFSRELPLRSSSLPTNSIAPPVNSLENITSVRVITTSV